MAKYAISIESTEALNKLANDLIICVNSVVHYSDILDKKIADLSDGLGLYAKEISGITSRNKAILLQNVDLIFGLAYKINVFAEEINTEAGTEGMVATSEEMAGVEEVGSDTMVPVTGSEVKDGTYEINVESSSSMFRIVKAELTVQDGSAHIRRNRLPAVIYGNRRGSGGSGCVGIYRICGGCGWRIYLHGSGRGVESEDRLCRIQ